MHMDYNQLPKEAVASTEHLHGETIRPGPDPCKLNTNGDDAVQTRETFGLDNPSLLEKEINDNNFDNKKVNDSNFSTQQIENVRTTTDNLIHSASESEVSEQDVLELQELMQINHL